MPRKRKNQEYLKKKRNMTIMVFEFSFFILQSNISHRSQLTQKKKKLLAPVLLYPQEFYQQKKKSPVTAVRITRNNYTSDDNKNADFMYICVKNREHVSYYSIDYTGREKGE